jgi:hypothetical protein
MTLFIAPILRLHGQITNITAAANSQLWTTDIGVGSSIIGVREDRQTIIRLIDEAGR